MGFGSSSTFTLLLLLFLFYSSTDAYDPLDPYGNITIKWDIITWTADGYVATVTIFNFQKYRHIQAPGWQLGWTWAKKEIIWNIVGSQATEQGDCSKFKGTIPHCCKKTPTVVDLMPGTPYNQQFANCCRGGVISSWVQDPTTSISAFQISVGQSGTTNKTVKVPRNFTLKAPGPGYTCGPGKIVKPSQFITPDGRRKTQALINDVERYVHVLSVSVSENSDMLRLTVILLQRYHRTVPYMQLRLPKQHNRAWELCRARLTVFGIGRFPIKFKQEQLLAASGSMHKPYVPDSGSLAR
ncbi:hypothetical protein RND81_06G111400 [Saponaria officinalis]|uniref:COBRA-like protein n=1 Tax=Saponaria officinalis TaxID=3572 RepID=A0AAW1K4Y8_SAPOF